MAGERERAGSSGPRGAPPGRIPRCHPPAPAPPLAEGAATAYREALAAFERADWEAAETALRLALARDDHRSEPWLELGVLLAEVQRFEEALRPLERSLELDPAGYEARRFRALCLERLGRPEEAALAYRDFLDRCPEEHQKVRLHAERSLEALGGPADALTPAVPGEGELEQVPAELEAEVREREEGRRFRLGVLALVLVLGFGLLPESSPGPAREGAPRLGPGRKGSPGAEEVAVAVAGLERGEPGAADRLGQLVSLWRGEPVTEALETAVEALARDGSPESSDQLVNCYATAARGGRRSSRVRAYMKVLAAALARLDAAVVQGSVGRARARVSPPQGPADQLVLEALAVLSPD
jgi:tetratricopeptide (TPR) repeat protein